MQFTDCFVKRDILPWAFGEPNIGRRWSADQHGGQALVE